MAIAGTWKAQRDTPYASALRQGTGWNPIHAIRAGEGRNIAPDATGVLVPEGIVDHDVYDQYGYSEEDSSSSLWGYGVQTGTADRPSLDDSDERNNANGYPAYSPSAKSGIPGGWRIRALNKGADANIASKTGAAMPDAAQGHLNKVSGNVDDAVVSDPVQYEMQTSMTQRDKTRQGSQRGSGSASEYDAPIHSERPTWGQQKYVPSGGERHSDMLPKQQDLILRPFQFRTAGTGPASWMEANEMYVSEPRQRIPGADPWQGVDVPAQSGYIDEDSSYYV